MGSPETDEASIPMDNRELDELKDPATWEDDEGRCIRPYSSLAPSFRCGSHRKKWNASSTKRRHSDFVYRSSSGMPH